MLLKGVAGSSIILPVFSANIFAPNMLVSTSVINGVRTRAARLANYATFGANEDTVNHITNIGWEAWVDEQLSMPITLLYPMQHSIPTNRHKNSIIALGGPMQWLHQISCNKEQALLYLNGLLFRKRIANSITG